MISVTTPFTDAILINGKLYSKKRLTLDWFQMSNDGFYPVDDSLDDDSLPF